MKTGFPVSLYLILAGYHQGEVRPGVCRQGMFDVFDSSVTWMGGVPAPPGYGDGHPLAWTSEWMALITQDDQGLPLVVRYRIQR